MTKNWMQTLSVQIVINVGLGIVLWFGFLTDYEFSSTAVNVLFPLFVLVVGIIALRRAKVRRPRNERRWLLIACVPSLVGGLWYAVVLAVFCLTFLAPLFWISEQLNATRIQTTASPDGRKTAHVYFMPVGAYSGGKGHIEVKLTYSWLPFVRRQVYFRRVSLADEDSVDYLSWDNATTLRISEGDFTVDIGWIRMEKPFMMIASMRLLGY